MTKIKVFLGAYINQTNAQNLNCRALARFIDYDKFEVYALEINHGNLSRLKRKGLKCFNCFFPVKLTGRLGFLWGIYHCDVAYLPRGNFYRYQRFLLRLFKRKSFKTIENILDDTALKSAVAAIGSEAHIKEAYSYCDELYSITAFMQGYNNQRFGIRSEALVLPVINDTSFFSITDKARAPLKALIFVGNDMLRKGVRDYLALAAAHSDLSFHIVGKESHGINIKALVEEQQLANVTYHGLIDHDALLGLFKRCQLYVLPSRSEGFPKAIVETAAAGIPTMTYPDYGADEWIVNDKNGYIAKDTADMIAAVERYKNNADLLQGMSRGASALAEDFEVGKVVRMYEQIIENLYQHGK